jgi:hypothetical protein
MVHGLKPNRVDQIRQALDFKIDHRTLERWRQWWLAPPLENLCWRNQLPHRSRPANQPL